MWTLWPNGHCTYSYINRLILFIDLHKIFSRLSYIIAVNFMSLPNHQAFIDAVGVDELKDYITAVRL